MQKSSFIFMAPIFFFSFVTVTSNSAVANITTRTINDSLVQNLECQNLSVNNIYHSIRDDAFDVSRNMPVRNWSFKSGAATIAGCWALSRTQRMISYLARYNTSSENHMENRVSTILDMIRGATLVPRWTSNSVNEFAETGTAASENAESTEAGEDILSESGENIELSVKSIKKYWEKKLNNYRVFEVEDSSFSEGKLAPTPDSLWKALQIGYEQYFEGKKVKRNFREEIQALQARLFFRLQNLEMIWKKGDRSDKRNLETIKLLTKNLDGKRLTLINLRMDRTRQHVVMAKSYKKISPELYEIKVYDSNSPNVDSIVYYNSHRYAFFSPEILTRFKDKKPYRNLGVFIVHEQDRTHFETAMLNYYQELCKP